jgi:hypothetical protein
MESHPKFQILDWQDSPPPVAFEKQLPRRLQLPTLIGLLG